MDGVTSAIQIQLNAKAPIESPTFTGTLTAPTGLTGVLRADSGVVSTDSDVTDIVAAASAEAAGKVELATTVETETGTDTNRAVTPDALHDMTTLLGAAWMLDEDNMASDSAVKVPSQQSVKAYVDGLPVGVDTFAELTDTPSAYTAEGGKFVAVNETENGLEFIPIPSGGGILEVSEDTSPQLGGNLDAAGFSIFDSVNSGIKFDNAAYFEEDALTFGSTVAWDLGASPAAKLTLGGNAQLLNPTNKRVGTYILRSIQDGTGNHALTYDTDYVFPSGEVPSNSLGASKYDIITFYCDGDGNMNAIMVKDFS